MSGRGRAHRLSGAPGHASAGRVHLSGGHFLLLDLAPNAGPAPAIRRGRLVKGMDVKNVSHRFESDVPRRRVGVRTAADSARLGAALGEVLSARQGGSASS